MNKAGGIVAIIAGILGVFAAGATLFFGGLGAALQAEKASAVVWLGWGGLLFSFLTIVLGAVSMEATTKKPGAFLMFSSIAGAILGGTLVAIFMVLAFIGGLLATFGVKKEALANELIKTASVGFSPSLPSNTPALLPITAPEEPRKLGAISKVVLIVWLLFGLIGLGSIVILNKKDNSSSRQETSSSDTSRPNVKVANSFPTPIVEAPALPGSQWSYSQSSDAMSKGSTFFAYVSSTNTANFKFPYAGEQHAELNLRINARGSKDVFINIEKGQILCKYYGNCSILIRFDDEPATRFSTSGASTHSTTVVFLNNYGLFLGKLLKAKRVRVSLDIYQEAPQIFEFDVSGFDPKKYKPS